MAIRTGNLSAAFKHGHSEMYSRIAQICVLYEDLRIETGRLFTFVETVDFDNIDQHSFEVLYYIRRSTVSLLEFGGALNQLTRDKEFKQQLPSLPKKQSREITQANRHFQANRRPIEELRNNFGGHFQFKYAQHATANFPHDEIGKVEWASESKTPWFLKIDLAANIITSGLEYALKPNADVMAAFRAAIVIIGNSFQHVQMATYSLVYCFLWDRLQHVEEP